MPAQDWRMMSPGERAHRITELFASLKAGLEVFEKLPPFRVSSDFGKQVLCVVEERVNTTLRLAEYFPYTPDEIYPLVCIIQDEALIRSVLADYLECPDALALARAQLLAMQRDETQ